MRDQSFYSKVYEVVKQIPRGKVATYKEIAKAAGSPKAYRAVGTLMRNNPDLSTIPCHRVIGSDGRMRGYSAGKGIITKVQLLKSEGVLFIGNRVQLNTSV
jgi:O-6-methylguanine DNA methyltransferase